MDTLAVDWWKFGDLARDIYIHLRLKELESSLYPFQSRGQKWRRYLVDALAVTCDVKKFCDRTLHLAVHMLDVFMDRQPSESADPLQQIAVGCLWIAVKFEERNEAEPVFSDLERQFSLVLSPVFIDPNNNNVCPNAHSPLQIELTILWHLQWKLCVPTAAHFADYFLAVCVSEEDSRQDATITDVASAQESISQYTHYFLDISLQDDFFRSLLPSHVCAAALASARVCIEVSPVWNLVLQKITQYTWVELEPTVQAMLRIHQSDQLKMEVCKQHLATTPEQAISPFVSAPDDSPSTPLPFDVTPVKDSTQSSLYFDGSIKYGYFESPSLEVDPDHRVPSLPFSSPDAAHSTPVFLFSGVRSTLV